MCVSVCPCLLATRRGRHVSPSRGGGSPSGRRNFNAAREERSKGRGRPGAALIENQDEDAELASMLRLLACMREVTHTHRSLVLPSDPAAMSCAQQVVDYFMHEVEACQQAGDMSLPR
eukprot:gnl/TRDRNA2_/TRDRNA2_125690_c0_seq1.p1 gnl/TRDRNA2_/TRDRNA2_125690_c0~~gnl/TRDRNA2_/TRDRNA2_125690_c0_seq1.p1  ORF type:complete len:118 (+),score=16.25 gnl/TRDRNA2_/TRDRNA2_125690_c0_seq1:72-425(+)